MNRQLTSLPNPLVTRDKSVNPTAGLLRGRPGRRLDVMTETSGAVGAHDDRPLDSWLLMDVVEDRNAAQRHVELYELVAAWHPTDRRIQPRRPDYGALVDTAAGDWTVTGWRLAGRLAELGGAVSPTVAYRRKALQAAGLDPDLEPTSSGYLMTIYPRRVERAGDDAVVYCTVPTVKDGGPCRWRQTRHRAGEYQAHEDYLRHIIHDHATTATPVAEPF